MAAHCPIGVNNMETYKGKLLVAHPMLTKGLFARSVIYVYQDDATNGVLGLILNKPTPYKVSSLLAERNMDYTGNEHVYKGGPVNEQAIVMLHEDKWYSGNTVQTSTGLAISSDIYMMEKMSFDNKPTEWRMFAGIAGWTPGQLDLEIKRQNGWLTCDADPSIVFAKDGERQWNNAVQKCANQMIDQYL
jgi:putative transcriptional regulator